MKTPRLPARRPFLGAGLIATPLVFSLPLFAQPTSTAYWDGSTDTAATQRLNWSTTLEGGTDVASTPNSLTTAWYFNVSTLNANTVVGLNDTNGRNTYGMTFANSGTTTIQGHPISGSISSNFTIGAGGITVNSGAGAVISGVSARGTTTHRVAANQSWTNHSASSLTIGTAVTTSGNAQTLTLASTNTGNISINGAVSNGASGALSLVVNSSGTGTVVIANGNNSFTGSTRLQAGTVRLNNANALKNSTVTWQEGDTGSLVFLSTLTSATIGGLSGSRNLTLATGTGGSTAVTLTVGGNNEDTVYSGGLGGLGGVIKAGTGTLTLSGTNTYSGSTAVDVGELIVDGSLANTTLVSVVNGAALGGDGSISGAVSFASGSNFIFNTTASLTVTGAVSFGGFGIGNVLGLDESTISGTYVLLDGTGSNISQTNVLFGPANKVNLGADKIAYLTFINGDLGLEVAAIPEPGSFAAIGGFAALGLAGLRRRRRSI